MLCQIRRPRFVLQQTFPVLETVDIADCMIGSFRNLHSGL